MQIHLELVSGIVRYFKDGDTPMVDEYPAAGTMVFSEGGKIAEIKGVCSKEKDTDFFAAKDKICELLKRYDVKYFKFVRKHKGNTKTGYIDINTKKIVREKDLRL